MSTPKQFTALLKAALNALVDANQQYLEAHGTHDLYASGVTYREDIMSETVGLIPDVKAKGYGTSAELACWRCAELRQQGREASIRIVWERLMGGAHAPVVQVRIGGKGGEIEDPARIVEAIARGSSIP